MTIEILRNYVYLSFWESCYCSLLIYLGLYIKTIQMNSFFYLIKHTMHRCYRWNKSNRLLSEWKSKSILTSIQGIIILLYPPVISICRGLVSASFTHVYKFFFIENWYCGNSKSNLRNLWIWYSNKGVKLNYTLKNRYNAADLMFHSRGGLFDESSGKWSNQGQIINH